MLRADIFVDFTVVYSFCCRPHGLCIAFHTRRCREHAVWTLVSATCSLYLTVSLLVGVYDQVFTVRSADVSPGVGSLVGGEFSQSLGARLLVSALRAVGATCNQDSTCF